MILKAKGMVFAVGRLTKDAETRHVGDKKTKKVSFGIAVSEKGEPSEYVNAICWPPVASYAESLKKGDIVFAVGIDKTREWEGKTYTDTDIKFLSKQTSGTPTAATAFENATEITEEKMPWD